MPSSIIYLLFRHAETRTLAFVKAEKNKWDDYVTMEPEGKIFFNADIAFTGVAINNPTQAPPVNIPSPEFDEALRKDENIHNLLGWAGNAPFHEQFGWQIIGEFETIPPYSP